MRAGGSKAKGAEFERYACKALSLWVSKAAHKNSVSNECKLRDDLFWRSAMSGGRATQQQHKGKITGTQAGDVSALAGHGAEFARAKKLISKFVIECKAVKDLQLTRLVSDGQGFVRKTWNEVLLIDRQDRSPMLIMKQNRGPVLMAIAANALTHDVVSQLHTHSEVAHTYSTTVLIGTTSGRQIVRQAVAIIRFDEVCRLDFDEFIK